MLHSLLLWYSGVCVGVVLVLHPNTRPIILNERDRKVWIRCAALVAALALILARFV